MSWDDFWRNVSVPQMVGWVLGVLLVVGFFAKGWPKIRAFVRLVDALAELPQFITETTTWKTETTKKIDDIHHEVHYNNGTSVKDAIKRLEDAAGTTPAKPARKRPTKPKE